jgi:hypothetical protein
MLQTRAEEKFETYFMFNNVYRAVYEIIWKNTVQTDRPQMTLQYGASTFRV